MPEKKQKMEPIQQPAPSPLSEETFVHGLQFLCDSDPDLAQILANLGKPRMRTREPGFPALIHIILEQQVSLASAKAAYDRLLKVTSPLTPGRFIRLNDDTLKNIGFSRQKTGYSRNLARSIKNGRLDLAKFVAMDDSAVRSELTRVKGIGPWTANVYLLTALRRPDIWPSRDLALAVAAQGVKRLKSRPTSDELDVLGANWKPWRTVAAGLLWHYYSNQRVL